MTSKSAPMTDTETSDWVLVPREPVPEMLGAWYRYKNGHRFHDEPPATDTSDYGAYRAMLAAAPQPLSASPKGGDLEPAAYIVHDPMAGEPEVSFIRTIGLENEPLYPAAALQSLKAERDAAREAIRLHAAWGFPADIQALIVKLEAAEAENATLEREIAELREALTPSGDTKAAYIGEFSFTVDFTNEDGEDTYMRVVVPWTTVKEIMAAIRDRATQGAAALEAKP